MRTFYELPCPAYKTLKQLLSGTGKPIQAARLHNFSLFPHFFDLD